MTETKEGDPATELVCESLRRLSNDMLTDEQRYKARLALHPEFVSSDVEHLVWRARLDVQIAAEDIVNKLLRDILN